MKNVKRRTKLGFVLLSPSENALPSTRISVINMIPYLEHAGFDPSIVFEPKTQAEVPDLSGLATRLIRQGFDVVYFQKVHGASVLREIAELAAANVRTVYGVCDLVDPAMAYGTDLTLVVTEFLKQLYPAEIHHKIQIVHDGIERPEIAKTTWNEHSGTRSRPLNLVLVTSVDLSELPVLGRVPDWARVSIVGRYPKKDQVSLRLRQVRETLSRKHGVAEKLRYVRLLSDPRISLVPWHVDHVYDCMVAADVGIIPVDRRAGEDDMLGVPPWKLKSENRLTMKMAIGLPVVATPIPSYLSVVKDGQNAFLAETVDDWWRALEQLRSPDERRRVGRAARESVFDSFSMDAQAVRLIAALKSILP